MGEGWYDLEREADDGRLFRWTSTRSTLAVGLGETAIAPTANLVLRIGTPESRPERWIAITGPQGTARQALRVGWHDYAFPLREVLGQSPESQQVVSIDVSDPVPAPGDSRLLGVMVTEVSVEGGQERVRTAAESNPAAGTAPGADISLSAAVVVGKGWYGLERAADDGRPLRWTSARSFLEIQGGPGAIPSRAILILHLGTPGGAARREVSMTGPGGTIRHILRPGWDYYAFSVPQIIGEAGGLTVPVSIDVSEPLSVPGDPRALGVMVDQIRLEDDGRDAPFALVEGMVASVKTYDVNGTRLRICDYAGSTAPDIVAGELQTDEYQLDAIAFEPGDVVIDIGGHIGAFSNYLATRYPFLTILAFEPIPVSYRMFRKNVELNEARNIRLYNLAVTSDRRELTLVVHLQGNTGGATANLRSLDLEGHARFACPSLTLDDIFQSFLIDSCKLLKIDCEGSEHEILLSARCLDRVQNLRGEFHINEHLRRQGYSIDRLAQHCRRFVNPERMVFVSCQMAE